MAEYDFTDPLDDSRWRLARDGNGLAFLNLMSPGVTQPRHVFDRLADETFRLAAENSALRTACGMLQKDEVSREAAAYLVKWCRRALLQSEPMRATEEQLTAALAALLEHGPVVGTDEYTEARENARRLLGKE